MLRDLNEHLVHVQEQLALRSRLRRTLDAAQERLRHVQVRLNELEGQLDKEHHDVRQLEGLSLTGLFYTLLGTKEERLDVERQEAVAAQLHRDEAQAEMDLLEAEVTRLEQQLVPLRDLDARYQWVLHEKERIIAATNNEQAQVLVRLSSKLAADQVMLHEVNEAIEAAQAVMQSLQHISTSLQHAGNWGVYDMLGGGVVATMIKHGHMDDARERTTQVQHLLRRLRRELSDIQLQLGEVGDVSGFETFADYFFDGLIMDWVVQSRINHSATHVQGVSQRVRDILLSLEQKRDALERQVRKIKTQRRHLLETTV